MAKIKVSQWDSVAANNTDINSININEGCPPSTINNAIRELMAQVKDWQDGSSGDGWSSSGTVTSSGTFNITGSLELDGSTGSAGEVLVSSGTSATPTWGSGFPTGGIIMWSGSVASIPSGWVLCDGTNSTPDLRNKFVMGAGDTYNPDDTGGSADTVVPQHTHTGSLTINTKTGLDGTLTLINRGGSSYNSTLMRARSGSVTTVNQGNSVGYGEGWEGEGGSGSSKASFALNHNHTGSVSINNAGESVTGKNNPEYYALAYIMKS